MSHQIIHNLLTGLTSDRIQHEGEIIVIGLGRFGSAVAKTLVELGYEVLGVDNDESLVHEHTSSLTHVVQADTTRPTIGRCPRCGAGCSHRSCSR